MKFKRIFVIEPAHDISKLSEFSDDIRIVCDGSSRVSESFDVILSNILDFDYRTDAIIPMGRTTICTISGIAFILKTLADMCEEKYEEKVFFTIGVFTNSGYIFESIGVE